MNENVQGQRGERLAPAGAGLHPEGMSDQPRRGATYEDLENLPPHFVGEVVGGELYASPRPRVVHARAAGQVFRALGSFDEDTGGEGPGGWWLVFEPELRLGRDVLVPDLAGWRRERLPKLPDVAAMTLAPDWVCEVLSPSTETLDRVRKMGAYAREGVRHLWLVDPGAKMLEVYRLEEGRWLRLGAHSGEVSVHAEPFERLPLRLGALWAR